MKLMMKGAALAAVAFCLAGPAMAGDEGPTLSIGDKAPPIDIEFWVKNEHPDVAAAPAWILSVTLISWPNLEMFEHVSIGGMKLYPRLVNISGGNVDIFAGPE